MDMFFTLERGEKTAQVLAGLVCRANAPVAEFKVKEGNSPEGFCEDCAAWPVYRLGDVWHGEGAHRWFRAELEIPAEWQGGWVELHVTTGREGQWDATNPQMLLYINGEVVQGMDVNHTAALLSSAANGERFSIALLAYSGTAGADLMLKAEMVLCCKPTEKLYYDLAMPVQSARLLQKKDPENQLKILAALEPVLNTLDLREPYSAEYYQSVGKATQMLKEAFYQTVNTEAPLISAIGHTHIDIAWLWTVEQTKEKAVRSFATVLRLMEEYPEYIFMSSQPVLYDFVKSRQPALYEKIKSRVAEGRWETDGVMWLEPDCNIPAGESLVRQILKGHRYFKSEFGTESKTLWLPDVFGYSAALPQILRKSRIERFMTTKISWNQYNQLPNDTFKWRGIDGSEVFVFMPTTCDYNSGLGLNRSFSDTHNTTTYTGIINPNMLLGTYERFQNKNLTQNVLMLFGFGDGGGGPTREMLENAKRLRYGLPGMPRISIEPQAEFFDRAYDEIFTKEDAPTWDGELYFEYHRGTYTSMAKNKRYNREAEILYGKLETLAFMASFFAIALPVKEIEKGWDCILLNQFHDILPGTAIEEVYKTTDAEYGEILTAGKRELQSLAGLLARAVSAEAGTEKQNGIVVFNTMGYSRSDVVYAALPAGNEDLTCLRDAAGNTVPVQHMPNGQAAFYAEEIPPLGCKTYWCVRGGHAESPQHSLPVVENKYYRAVVESDLTLSSLWEKQTGRELVAKGKRANQLLCFEDRPMNWDNWDIDIYYRKKKYEPTQVTPYRVVSCGSVMTILENTLVFSNSVIHQQAVFYRDMPRIDFVHKVQWQQHNLLLKACFDTDIYAPRASFEIQFGNVERETTNNNSWDTAKFETCAHKWADLSDHGCGLSLLNNCKYGHYIKDRRMELTLIKAGKYPNENADIGSHEYTYSLYPHPGGWRDAETVAQAYNLNVPAEAVFVKEVPFGGGAGQKSWVQVSAPNCFIEGVKPAEDGNGFILRVYENNNRQTRAHFSFSVPVRGVQACNLLEETECEIDVAQGEFEDVLKPYEIKSYRLLV